MHFDGQFMIKVKQITFYSLPSEVFQLYRNFKMCFVSKQFYVYELNKNELGEIFWQRQKKHKERNALR